MLVHASGVGLEYGLMVQCSMLFGRKVEAAADAGQSLEIIFQPLSLLCIYHAFRQQNPVLGCHGDVRHSSDDNDDGHLSSGGHSDSPTVQHQPK